MLFKPTFLALLSAATVTNALAVIWPTDYVPTDAEKEFAESRRAIVARGEETNGTLIDRALPSGCVQAHCGGVKGTVSEIWKSYYEITVEHNGRQILHLMGTSSQKLQWHGIYDPSGNQWGLEMKGNCDSLNYLNTIQSQYGWIGLSRPDSRTRTEKKGGWCIGSPRGDKCTDAKFWESTFRDNGQCRNWAKPQLCDNWWRCVDLSGVKSYNSE